MAGKARPGQKRSYYAPDPSKMSILPGYSNPIHSSNDEFNKEWTVLSPHQQYPTRFHVTNRPDVLWGSHKLCVYAYSNLMAFGGGYAAMSVFKGQSDYEKTNDLPEIHFTSVLPMDVFRPRLGEVSAAAELTAHAQGLIQRWKVMNPNFPAGDVKNPLDVKFVLCRVILDEKTKEELENDGAPKNYPLCPKTNLPLPPDGHVFDPKRHSSSIVLTLSTLKFTNSKDTRNLPGRLVPNLSHLTTNIKVHSSKLEKGRLLDDAVNGEKLDGLGYRACLEHLLFCIGDPDMQECMAKYDVWKATEDERKTQFDTLVAKAGPGGAGKKRKRKVVEKPVAEVPPEAPVRQNKTVQEDEEVIDDSD